MPATAVKRDHKNEEGPRRWSECGICVGIVCALFLVIVRFAMRNPDSPLVEYYHHFQPFESDTAVYSAAKNHSEQIDFLLTKYEAEVLYTLSNSVIKQGVEYYRMIPDSSTGGKQFTMLDADLCRTYTLLNLFELSQMDRVDVHALFRHKPIAAKENRVLSVPPAPLSIGVHSKREILIVVTTCNQLSMTIMSLQYLRNTGKVADVVVIDDHSTDGTVEYVKKKGFAIISKRRPTGLTDSWNIGYRLAIALGYKQVLFTNNDFEAFANDYRNAEFIQETLLRRYIYVPKAQRRCPSQTSVDYDNRPKFNGFCFGVNLELIAPAAFEANVHLFDPRDRIVGQEDALTLRMEKAGLLPILLHCTFVFHFKSHTVAAANFTTFASVVARHGGGRLRIVEASSLPTVRLAYTDPATSHVAHFTVDIREDLHWYHATGTATGQSPFDDEAQAAQFVQRLLERAHAAHALRGTGDGDGTGDGAVGDGTGASGSPAVLPSVVGRDIEDADYEEAFARARAAMDASRKAQRRSQRRQRGANGTADGGDGGGGNDDDEAADSDPEGLWAELSCRPVDPQPLFPRHEAHDPVALQAAYTRYPSMGWNIRSNPTCIYPSQWAPHCNALLRDTRTGDGVFAPALYAQTTTTTVVVAIAMSNPTTHPSAGDVFTAYELGNALKAQFSRVKVKYLRRGPQWYSAAHLHDVDVLITLLDDFELPKVLALYMDASVPNYFAANEFTCHKAAYQVKPTLITVAWMRNWFHRWLTKPWLGNYDVLLTSSQLSKAFFDRVSQTIGVKSVCANSCPHKANGVAPPVLPVNHSESHQRLMLARLIRASSNASLEAGKIFFGVDYVFTGSYFNVYRRVMDFDPAALSPQWQGRIVGRNWLHANVSRGWKSRCTGFLPYAVVLEAYRYVRIVIDDANHVTYPWGSTNSRVFDALAAGALVVSNGDIGLAEVFGDAVAAAGLTLPIYRDAAELTALLEFYLAHESERVRLVQVMQRVVLEQHSYAQRARDLAAILADNFRVALTPRRQRRVASGASGDGDAGGDAGEDADGAVRSLEEVGEEVGEEGKSKKSKTAAAATAAAAANGDHLTALNHRNGSHLLPNAANPGRGICIGVRTTERDELWLPVLVRSLIVQHSRSKYRDRLPLQIFLADTEASTDYARSLMELADTHNERFRYPYVQLVQGQLTTTQPLATKPRHARNQLYGYDDTDRLLDVMLSIRKSTR
eukprot:gene5885-4227_t